MERRAEYINKSSMEHIQGPNQEPLQSGDLPQTQEIFLFWKSGNPSPFLLDRGFSPVVVRKRSEYLSDKRLNVNYRVSNSVPGMSEDVQFPGFDQGRPICLWALFKHDHSSNERPAHPDCHVGASPAAGFRGNTLGKTPKTPEFRGIEPVGESKARPEARHCGGPQVGSQSEKIRKNNLLRGF